ncbi:TIGR02587 family membrane protein [Ramlibacter sp.]|uniref:TIGR02587 family membrane protein n=1 Tax=Ramlibacter sp. TaxID=1917967 RepID=UPI002FC7B026
MPAAARNPDLQFAEGLARAFAGAVIFGLPLLMTMEMWWLGFQMSAGRLALLTALFFPFLVALSWHAGFEPTFSWKDDLLDALVAYGVAFIASALLLAMLGALSAGDGLRAGLGKVCLQAVPASIGALLAQSLLGESPAEAAVRGGQEGYFSELFIMAVGALFLAFNVAPTGEVQIISLQLDEWQALLLVAATLAVMHAFVYGANFRGRPRKHPRVPWWSLFGRFTVVGYAIALLLSAYLLWSFGRLEGLCAAGALKQAVVLGLPAAVGAAAARLIL